MKIFSSSRAHVLDQGRKPQVPQAPQRLPTSAAAAGFLCKVTALQTTECVTLASLRLPSSATATATATLESQELAAGTVRQDLSYVLQSLRRLGMRSPQLDELAREVLLELHDGATPRGPAPHLRPQLFEIAFRVVSAHHQHRLRDILRAAAPAAAGREDAASPQDEVTRTMVTAALGAVPLSRRTVLIMHDIDEVPLAEVARVFRLPRATVYVRLCKARRELEVELRRTVGRRDVSPQGR